MQFLFILKSLLQVSEISKNFLPGPLQNHQNHNFFPGPLLSYMVLTKTSWQPWRERLLRTLPSTPPPHQGDQLGKFEQGQFLKIRVLFVKILLSFSRYV